jgi:hypothetical protein
MLLILPPRLCRKLRLLPLPPELFRADALLVDHLPDILLLPKKESRKDSDHLHDAFSLPDPAGTGDPAQAEEDQDFSFGQLSGQTKAGIYFFLYFWDWGQRIQILEPRYRLERGRLGIR